MWDFREPVFADGQRLYAPADFSVARESHLNIDRLVDMVGEDYPGQKLFSHLRDAVQFKAELPLVLVLFPHLTSLPAGFARVDKDIVRFVDIGWYSARSVISFFPIRCVPQGSTPRKYEPDRPRRTSNGGAPRTRLEHDGIVIPSLNEVIDIHGFDDGGGSL